MKRITLAILSLLLSTACQPEAASNEVGSPADAPAATPAPGPETVLFDGSTLDGWNQIGGGNWRLDPSDGSVTADMGTEGHLVTPATYGDFALSLEFWAADETNSGVYIRCADPMEITAAGCYEINIFDQRPDPIWRTGAIVDVTPPLQQVDAGGRWNEMEVRAVGDRLTVVMNGIVTADAEASTHSEGVIGLQYSVGPIKFRDIRIQPLR